MEFCSRPISAFCLHFCSKSIRMRKTRHHMQFVYKRLGIIWGHFRAFLQTVFLFFAMKLIYVVLTFIKYRKFLF
jgi:hypothetical protein